MLSEEIWIHCSCKYDRHILCLSREVYPDEPEPEVSLQPFLHMHNSFLMRIWVALCYIFRWHENLGQFDNIYIEKADASRIIKFLQDTFPEEQAAVNPNCEKPTFDENNYLQHEKSTYYYFP